MPAVKTGSVQGAAAWKGYPRGNLVGNGKETSKDRNNGDGTQWTSKGNVREEIRAALNTINTKKKEKGKGKRRRSRSTSETRHWKGDGGDIRGKGPKGTSPSGKSNKRVCHHFQRQCRKESASDSWHPPGSHYNSQSGCTCGDTCVFKHRSEAGEDKHGSGTLALYLKMTEELNCVLTDGQGDTFSVRSILKKIGWPPTKEQFRVRYCRNEERHFRTRERKGPSLGTFQSGRKKDRNPNAPTNQDLHQQGTQLVKTNCKNATWTLHNIRGRYQEN